MSDPTSPSAVPSDVALYAAVGAELTQYRVDVAAAALTRCGTVRLPANVQYAWPHVSRRYLYVASSNSAPGVGPVGDRHHITAFAIDPASGALTRHGDPIRLPARHALGLAPGAPVAHVRRLRRHRGEPFLLIDSYFTMSAWQQIATADFNVYPFYDLLRTQFRFYIIAAEEFLTAGLATEEEARLLAIARGDAIVRLERIACSFGEERVEFRRCSGRGDHFRYHVRLR